MMEGLPEQVVHTIALGTTTVLVVGFVFGLIDTVMRSTWMRRIVCRHFAKPEAFADSAAGVKFSGQVAARVVGSLFLVLMFPSAVRVIVDPYMNQDVLYARNDTSKYCSTVASAYFLYDVWICTMRYSENGLAFLIHGVLCSLAYAYPMMSGNMHYLAANFLMWELSTPFLYFRWYLIKSKMGDGRLMAVANVLFALAFFGCRVVAGPVMSWEFFVASGKDILSRGGKHSATSSYTLIPVPVLYAYRCAMVVLNSLNYFWFYSIVKIAVSRGKVSRVTETEETLAANKKNKKVL